MPDEKHLLSSALQPALSPLAASSVMHRVELVPGNAKAIRIGPFIYMMDDEGGIRQHVIPQHADLDMEIDGRQDLGVVISAINAELAILPERHTPPVLRRQRRYRLATMPPGALYTYRVRVELHSGVELRGYGNTPDSAEDAAYEMHGADLNPQSPDVGDVRQMRWQLAVLKQRELYES